MRASARPTYLDEEKDKEHMSPLAIFLALVALFAVLAAVFYKLRKVHIAALETREIVSDIRTELAALFPQERWQELLIHQLNFSKPLPPTRGWAGSPDFLLQVAQYVAANKPRVVVECSSGVSTLVIARTMQQSGVGHVYCLEHDEAYAERTRQMLREYGVEDRATVFYAPLIERPNYSRWYDDGLLPIDLPPVELLVVDGPPMATGPLARYPALPLLLQRLAHVVTIFVDDADRDDEREMLRRWQREVQGLQVEFRFCEKGLAIVSGTRETGLVPS